jgi:hypothetical protein
VATREQQPALLDVYLVDLEATLQESERSAGSLERRLTVTGSAVAPIGTLQDSVDRVLYQSRTLVDEARRCLENTRVARQLLRQLQTECQKLRRS